MLFTPNPPQHYITLTTKNTIDKHYNAKAKVRQLDILQVGVLLSGVY